MSHELRTPVSAVLGFAASLRDGAAPRETVVDVASRIEAVSRDLLGIINNILDAAKLESGHVQMLLEEVDPAEVVDRVVKKCDVLAKKKGLVLRREEEELFPEAERLMRG